MKLEKSPTLKDSLSPRSTPTLGELLSRYRWVLPVILGAILLLDAIALAFIMLNATGSPAVGGLEGCVQTAGGAPVSAATLTVAGSSRQTYDDGCFFFATLPAGDYELLIDTEGGTWQESVSITAGQATSLGTITFNPSGE